MRVDWMKVGKEHWKGNQERIINICESAEWTHIPKEGITIAMMPALGIEGVIKEFKIPKVSHIAILRDLAPFGLYGIRGHYKNGDADIFVVDEGDHISPLCSFFTEREV